MLRAVAVATDFQRTGLSDEAMQRAFESAWLETPGDGPLVVLASVDLRNAVCQAMNRRHGLQPIGEPYDGMQDWVVRIDKQSER